MGLVFFLAACGVLCFRPLTKTVMITHQCFSYGWTAPAQHRGHLCFSLCPQTEEAGVGRSLAGDTAGTADWDWPRCYSVPDNFMFRSYTGVVFSKAAIPWRLPGHQFVGGKQWVIVFASPFFFLLSFFFSPSLIQLPLSQPKSFSSFLLFWFSPPYC